MPSLKNQRDLWNNPTYVIILSIVIVVVFVITTLVD